MSSIEKIFLMVVISTITTRDTLETLTGQMATLEGKKTNPLISLETNLVLAHTMQTSKKDLMSAMKLPLNMFKKTKS